MSARPAVTGPIVTKIDRDWALAQKPRWARMTDTIGDGEVVDDGSPLDAPPSGRRREPSWFDFVTGEVERFERFFAGERKSYAEWSALWRRGWWPKRREDWVFEHGSKRPPQPFTRSGSAAFGRAMALGSAEERRMWQRFGVAQFKPDDWRLPEIFGPSPDATEGQR